MSNIEIKTKKLWGRDLHKNSNVPAHCHQIKKIFTEKWRDTFKGHLLEIGCGSGADLEIFSQYQDLKKITAIDLGENIKTLSKKYRERKDISILRGNALNLNFESNKFDVIYSFGVFHHTSDPIKCLNEAFRVLKKDGAIFLYLYGTHEDLVLKRIGIFIEKITMKLFGYMSYSFQNIICVFLSPLCWMIFTIPSMMIKYLGFYELASKFPFYFGSHPFSLIGDLKDRLMSPINHRFTKIEIERILKSASFVSIEVEKTSSGLYIFAKK